MAYKQTIATEATENSPFALVRKQHFINQADNTISGYNSILQQEIAKIANPAFEQLDINVTLFTGVVPSRNSNGVFYYKVRAQTLISGDVEIIIGDRNGATLGSCHLPLGCGVISVQNEGSSLVDHGFNQDVQNDFSVKYNGAEKSGDNGGQEKLVVQNLEIKRASDSLDQVVIGEFFVQIDDGANDDNSVKINGAAAIIAVVFPVPRQNPALPDTDADIPAPSVGDSLEAALERNINNHYGNLLDCIIAAKQQVRNFFGIDDINIDVATYPVAVTSMYRNINEYFYVQVRARMLPNGEMQVQVRRRANHTDDSTSIGDKDNAQDGKLIADLYTPHGAAALMLSRASNTTTSGEVYFAQGNLDEQDDYEVSYNSARGYDCDNRAKSGAQVLEIKSATLKQEWTVVGELGFSIYYPAGRYDKTFFPAVLLSMYSLY